MIELGLIGGGLIVVGLYVAVATLPRWCFGSVWRHCLWALRDELVGDILDGNLPGDHPAVCDLRHAWERRRLTQPSSRLIDIVLFDHLILRRVPPSELLQLEAQPSIDGLSDEEQRLVLRYRERSAVLFGGALVSSSWLGALILLASYLASTPRSFTAAVARMKRWPISRSAARGVQRSRSLVRA